MLRKCSLVLQMATLMICLSKESECNLALY